jgi:hypothetical protein
MNIEAFGEFGNRLIALDCGHRHFGLEGRRVVATRTFHDDFSSSQVFSTRSGGSHHTRGCSANRGHRNVRPIKSNDKAANSKTGQRYCVYDAVHNDYTYYDLWVQKFVSELNADPLATIAKWKRAVTRSAVA